MDQLMVKMIIIIHNYKKRCWWVKSVIAAHTNMIHQYTVCRTALQPNESQILMFKLDQMNLIPYCVHEANTGEHKWLDLVDIQPTPKTAIKYTDKKSN